eukprot:13899857-Alexandrium_andersonii.AAC.1
MMGRLGKMGLAGQAEAVRARIAGLQQKRGKKLDDVANTKKALDCARGHLKRCRHALDASNARVALLRSQLGEEEQKHSSARAQYQHAQRLAQKASTDYEAAVAGGSVDSKTEPGK